MCVSVFVCFSGDAYMMDDRRRGDIDDGIKANGVEWDLGGKFKIDAQIVRLAHCRSDRYVRVDKLCEHAVGAREGRVVSADEYKALRTNLYRQISIESL